MAEGGGGVEIVEEITKEISLSWIHTDFKIERTHRIQARISEKEI